jgi:uncharacterized OB-fold protein
MIHLVIFYGALTAAVAALDHNRQATMRRCKNCRRVFYTAGDYCDRCAPISR